MPSLELRVPPLLVGAFFTGAMFVLAKLLPQLSMAVPLRAPLIVVFLAVGAAIALGGVLAFRRHRTTVNPLNPDASSSMVVTGIYRVSRNPMYLGLLLFLAAWAVHLSNAAAALLLPGFVVYMNRFPIQPEERTLLAKFGVAFADYMSHVRRWV